MDKQELAFKAWLNTILLPAAAEQAGSGQHALASRRLAARVRGQLWCIYQRDEQFRDTMLRVEERVLAGGLRMRDEVRRGRGRTVGRTPLPASSVAAIGIPAVQSAAAFAPARFAGGPSAASMHPRLPTCRRRA